jgi:hypothetical protein
MSQRSLLDSNRSAVRSRSRYIERHGGDPQSDRDCEEDRTLRAVLVGMLREGEGR